MNGAGDFGKLVRARRDAMQLSQEALAALALGNSERKGYISTIENGRRKIAPATARRLAEVLGIEPHEVPAELRWHEDRAASPESHGPPAQHDPVASSLAWARALIERRIARSPPQEYRRALVRGLRGLDNWTGRPFGLRSLGVSMTIAFVYTIFFGCLAYVQGGGAVGVVEVFSPPGWAGEVSKGTLALSIAILLAGTGAATMHFLAVGQDDAAGAILERPPPRGYRRRGRPRAIAGMWNDVLWPHPERPHDERRVFLVRAMLLGTILGGGAMAAGTLGADKTAAACFMAIVAFAAMATRGRVDAALAGASGGTVAGLIAGAVGEEALVEGVLTGVAMGMLVGGISGYCSAAVAETAPHPRAATLTGAGVGVALASVITITVLTLAYLALDVRGVAISFDTTALSVFLVVWVAFPLTNAVIDYLSLGVSHVFGRLAIRRARSMSGVALLAMYDLVAALALMVATTALLAAGLALAEVLSPWDLSPAGFFASAAADPLGAGIWFSMMILSTLSWTVLHFAFVVSPALAALISSSALHSRLLELHGTDAAAGRVSLPTVLLAYARPHITVLVACAIFLAGAMISIVVLRVAWDFLSVLGIVEGPFTWLAKLGLSITVALSSAG